MSGRETPNLEKQKSKQTQAILSLCDEWIFVPDTHGYTLAFRGEMYQPDLFQRSDIIFHSVDELCEIWFSSVFMVRTIKYFALNDLTFFRKILKYQDNAVFPAAAYMVS